MGIVIPALRFSCGHRMRSCMCSAQHSPDTQQVLSPHTCHLREVCSQQRCHAISITPASKAGATSWGTPTTMQNGPCFSLRTTLQPSSSSHLRWSEVAKPRSPDLCFTGCPSAISIHLGSTMGVVIVLNCQGCCKVTQEWGHS